MADLSLPAEDPFDGKPLRMKKAADGWLVYSVSMDQKDDGGQLDPELDVAFGPAAPLAGETVSDSNNE